MIANDDFVFPRVRGLRMTAGDDLEPAPADQMPLAGAEGGRREELVRILRNIFNGEVATTERERRFELPFVVLQADIQRLDEFSTRSDD